MRTLASARGRRIGWGHTMSRLLVSLSIFASVGTWVCTSSAETIRLDQVLFVTSPDWYVIQRRAVQDGQLTFRQYALPVINSKVRPDTLTNILNLQCSQRGNDYLTVHVPDWVTLTTIDEQSWISRAELRVLVDDMTFKTSAEYRRKEFFIDADPDRFDEFMSLLASKQLIIEFGPSDERTRIYRTTKMPDGGDINRFIKDKLPSWGHQGEKIGATKTLGINEMIKECIAFKKVR
jgi:hypothetical protein